MKAPLRILFVGIILFLGSYMTEAQTLTPKKKTLASIPDIPEFVEVEGGTFQMASSNNINHERAVHRVTVSSFSISKYPITVKQFRKFVMPSEGLCLKHPSGAGRIIIL